MPIFVCEMTNLSKKVQEIIKSSIYNIGMFISKKWNRFLELQSPKIEYLKVIFVYNPIICLILNLDSVSKKDFYQNYLFAYLVSCICASLCILASFLILKTSNKNIKTNFLSFISIQLLLLIPSLFIALQLSNLIFSYFFMIQAEESFLSFAFASSAYIILIFASLFAIDRFRVFKHQKQAQQIQLQKLEIENLNAKLQSLNQQLNPHFLFNSLNTLSAAINISPLLAEQMSLQLGDLYRKILEASKQNLNPLQNEIEICELYLSIEKIRFANRLEFNITLDKKILSKEFLLPSLCLHTLIENAMKHGISQLAEGGQINIHIQALDTNHISILVRNPYSLLKTQNLPSSHTGLNNLKSRIDLLYNTQAKIEILKKPDFFEVLLKIPRYEK